MLQDLPRRKLTRMFRYLDDDGDGVLVRGDYDRICRSLLRVLAAPPGSEGEAEIEASYATEWAELEELSAARGDGRVTLELWLAYREEQLRGPDAFEVMIDPYVGTVFTHLDRDGDGRLTSDDVRRYLGLYGMPAEDLDEILEKLDPERRGAFTRVEIGELARQFYFSTDERAPGSWLLGRW